MRQIPGMTRRTCESDRAESLARFAVPIIGHGRRRCIAVHRHAVAFKLVLHQLADLEADGLALGNRYGFHRARILGLARRTLADFEHAEVTKLKSLAFAQLLNHVVQKALDSALDIAPRLLCLVGD